MLVAEHFRKRRNSAGAILISSDPDSTHLLPHVGNLRYWLIVSQQGSLDALGTCCQSPISKANQLAEPLTVKKSGGV